MIVSHIVAMTPQRVIGKNNQLIWKQKEDLKFFKNKTLGHHLIMGRKTFDSIGGKPLKGRPHLIITRQKMLIPDVDVFASVFEAVDFAHERGESEVFICGGGEIYLNSLPLITRVYMTLIEADVSGDTFYPEFDFSNWKKVELASGFKNDDNQFNWKIYQYDKI